VPWLAGWDDAGLDPELRKSFEVSLHAGTAAALLIVLGRDARRLGWRELLLIGVAAAPPAIAGYLFERPVERYLGTPRAIAAGLLAGSVALALADRAPQRRDFADMDTRDALWLGLSQAAALIPGVSRSGAVLAAARRLGFSRADAHRVSRRVGLPVIGGATVLKGVRLVQRRLDDGARRHLAVGGGAAFVSTLGASRLVPWIEGDRALWPYAAYRTGLAAAILWRLRP
jgi:undecaprenyl-diphosphatase